MKKIFSLAMLAVPVAAVHAQAAGKDGSFLLTDSLLLFLVGMLLVILFFQSLLIRRLIILVGEMQRRLRAGGAIAEPEIAAPASPSVAAEDAAGRWQRLIERLTRPVPAGKQKDVLLSHDYDGIRELDNHMPPWLQMIFNATIVFAVVYLLYYHVFDIGPSSAEEYRAELQRAALKKEARLTQADAGITEESVVLLTDASSLQAGKEIFTSRCASCHGMLGEGTTVAPNLTDEYWLHGGRLNDVFRTIKYGVPAKGMIAWQGVLKPLEMQQTASYIMSLQGSNPPNARPPQGERYQPAADTLQVTASANGAASAILPQ